MTVQELIDKLQRANRQANVEVCVGFDYYQIDPEFTAMMDDEGGSFGLVFVIEADKGRPPCLKHSKR